MITVYHDSGGRTQRISSLQISQKTLAIIMHGFVTSDEAKTAVSLYCYHLLFWRTKFAQMCINYRMGYKARVHNFYTGVYSLLSLYKQYTGVHKLYTGLHKLYRGTYKLYAGVYKLNTGVDKLKRVKVADVTWGLGRRRKGVSCQFVVQGEYIKWTLHSRSSSQDHHVTIMPWLDP